MKCDEWRKEANHRIIIQKKVLVDDDIGGHDVTWTDLYTVWAQIKPISGREVHFQKQDQSRINSKFVIRYKKELKDTATVAQYRISYDDRVFPIKYSRNLADDMKNEGKQFQELVTVENEAENG